MRPHLRLDTGRDVSHQFPHDVLLAIESRHMEGRHAELPAEVPQRDVLLHELADDGAVAEPGGQVDRRHPGLVLVQRGGSTAQQQLDDVSVTALSRHVERGGVGDPVPVGRHDALVELEQLLQHPHAAFLCGDVCGGVAVLGGGRDQGGLLLQEQPHHLGLVRLGSQVDPEYIRSGQVGSGKATPTGFWPKSSVLSTPAPRLISMSQAACFPAEAARWSGVCFFCKREIESSDSQSVAAITHHAGGVYSRVVFGHQGVDQLVEPVEGHVV